MERNRLTDETLGHITCFNYSNRSRFSWILVYKNSKNKNNKVLKIVIFKNVKSNTDDNVVKFCNSF